MEEQKRVAQKVPPVRPPALEPLQPRVLPIADSIGLDLLSSLDAPFAGQAVYVDLDRQDHGTEHNDSSLILTYLASSDEADSLLAQDATVPLSEDDSPVHNQ